MAAQAPLLVQLNCPMMLLCLLCSPKIHSISYELMKTSCQDYNILGGGIYPNHSAEELVMHHEL
jgi:hypothetical protein